MTGNETVALLAEPTGCVDRTYFVFDSFIVETARFPGNKLTRLFSGANPSLVFFSPPPFSTVYKELDLRFWCLSVSSS